MEKLVSDTLNEESILDDQVKYECLKYNIRKYTVSLSK